MFDLNEAAYDLSWALDGVFLLLLGAAALALRSLPRWLAGWALVAGVSIEVGIAVPAWFDSLQLVFLMWLVVASIWSLRTPTPTTARSSSTIEAGEHLAEQPSELLRLPGGQVE